MMHRSLVGTWKLVSWEFRSADGEVSYPMGRSASGFLIYTPDGFMSATIMNPERPPFMSPDMRKATVQEKGAAFETYVSYCGTYEHRDGMVVHHVRASLFPNWIGGDQERVIEWVEDRLQLSTPPMMIDGIQRTVHLLWERFHRPND
jgi:hypothetical protein